MGHKAMELLKAAIAEIETREDREMARQTITRYYRINETISRIECALKEPLRASATALSA
jgi:hypothetical protein